MGNIVVCPVCGKTKFESSKSYEICSFCGWENDGVYEADGANKISLKEYKERYEATVADNPSYIWEYRNQKWYQFIAGTSQKHVNPERVESIEHIKNNPVLDYVLKTIDIAQKDIELWDENEEDEEILLTVLKWCEVAKCGSPSDRKRWKDYGIELDIHNEASSYIYICEETDAKSIEDVFNMSSQDIVIYGLINTHGLIGQCIRGEILFKENMLLRRLIADKYIEADRLRKMLMVLNHAVIGGVSAQLWDSIKDEVAKLVNIICDTTCDEEPYDTAARICRLFPNVFKAEEPLKEEEYKVFDAVLSKCSLWYPEVALEAFNREQIVWIFSMIERRIRGNDVRHVSFFPLASNIYYDYCGKKRVNIYKQRIIEFCIREMQEAVADSKAEEHIKFTLQISNGALYFGVDFTPVCEKLIDFCVEAERCDFMDYSKNLTTIFDLFGFRRDIFDRLNNEDSYLAVMNDASESRKTSLLEYVVGDAVIDVGSGGGVLLDELERRYPGKRIIGTDISTNVIEALQHKIDKEKHGYEVIKHNFVEGIIDISNGAGSDALADTIIFSSILHEIYSYTEWEGQRFCIEAVKTALQNAVESIRSGGRILIRDGIFTDSDKICRIRLKDKKGITFLKNYLNDFKGLKNLNDRGVLEEESGVFTADINLIREFLYTYTWGESSYPLEVNEQFGYMTLKKFVEFLEKIGMKIICAEEYLEPGYPEHLNDKVELLDGMVWEDIPSNCIIVCEKI